MCDWRGGAIKNPSCQPPRFSWIAHTQLQRTLAWGAPKDMLVTFIIGADDRQVWKAFQFTPISYMMHVYMIPDSDTRSSAQVLVGFTADA